MKKDYKNYGKEWKKEMMRLPKKVLVNKILIMMLKDEYRKKEDSKQIGNHKSPFGIGA